MAKKILDLDLNPKSFLSAGGRQRGGRAKRVLGPAEGGKGGFTATKVHGKEDFGLRAEKGFIAKKILDLDLNPKSFLAAGGRQRGGTARKILGLDLNPKSFSLCPSFSVLSLCLPPAAQRGFGFRPKSKEIMTKNNN